MGHGVAALAQEGSSADCLTCHERGVNDSPKLEHKSGLVEHLKQAKCRTCHVFVAGAQPRQ